MMSLILGLFTQVSDSGSHGPHVLTTMMPGARMIATEAQRRRKGCGVKTNLGIIISVPNIRYKLILQ